MKPVGFLVLIGLCCSGIACASRLSRAVADPAQACADVLRTRSGTEPALVRVTADCVLETGSADGANVRRLSLTTGGQGQIRRIVPTSDLVFVLRSRPPALDVYELPTLSRIPLVGALGFRRPADLVVVRTSTGQSTAYIVDNAPDSRFWSDADLVFEGPRVLRVTLERHKSPRRDVLVAQSIDTVGRRLVAGVEEQPLLDGIDLVDNELRVVVIEGRRRFAEYFSLDGVLLERAVIDASP